MPLTTEGSRFWVQPRRGYREQWAKNANQITAYVACDWADAGDVKQYLVGWTEWDGAAVMLDRFTPYQSPFGTNLFADSVELMEHGFKVDGSPDSDEDNDDWPLGDWCVYQVVFVRPPYEVIDDATTEEDGGGLESTRYVSVRWGYNGRERRRPGYVFETDEGSPIVVDEVGFIPDWSSVLNVTWWQIPERAFPAKAVAQCLARVNDAAVTFRGRTYPAETLLFRGCAQELEPYAGADGSLYLDPVYRFEFRPDRAFDASGTEVDSYGWNGYRKNNGDYVRLRVRNVTPTTRPYGAVDFGKLFIPSSTA